MNFTGAVVGSFVVLFVAGCDMESPAFQELTDGSAGSVGKKAGLPGEITGVSGDDGGGGGTSTSADASVEGSSASKLAKFAGDGTGKDGEGMPLNIVMGHRSSASGGSQQQGNGKGGKGGHSGDDDSDDEQDDNRNSSAEKIPSHSEHVSGDDRRECAAHFGGEDDDVKEVSDSGKYSIHDNDIIAIRVTGNGPDLEVDIGDDDRVHIRGVCIFVAGNQSTVRVNMKSDCGGLLYKGRGNQSRGIVTVAKDRDLDRVNGSLAGNQSYLEVGGEGRYPQGDVEQSGHGSNYVCR